MSHEETLGQIVQQREREQSRKSAARDVLTSVRDWRGKYVKIAQRRWVWELIQNAVDCGTREQKDVNIAITLENGTLTFEHDGGPFLPDELSALITGGSTKPFALASPYSGRFGIGFLVTHILSLKAKVEGTAKTENGHKTFELTLNRSGNTIDEISNGIEECYADLNTEIQARTPNTRYTYNLEHGEASTAIIPMSDLKKLLPYVMLFRERLKTLRIKSKSSVFSWESQERSTVNMGQDERQVVTTVRYSETTVDGRSTAIETIEIVALFRNDVASAISILHDGSRRICIPLNGIPKILAPYPLIGGTDELGVPLIIYGSFEPSKDRDTVLLSEKESEGIENRRKIKLVFEIIPNLIRYALNNKLEGVNYLAKICKSKGVPPEYQEWWESNLQNLISKLTGIEIVETDEGFKKPLDESLYFIAPLVSAASNISPEHEDFSENSFNIFWDFDKKVYDGDLRVRKNLALNWQLNVRHWLTFGDFNGLKNRIFTIEDACKTFKNKEKKSLEEAGIGSDDLQALLAILEESRDATLAVATTLLRDYPILVNQKGKLTCGKDIHIDSSVPEDLKNIAEAFEYNVREELLDNCFRDHAILKAACKGEKDEDSVIDSTISKIPRVGPIDTTTARACARLTIWLAEKRPESNYVEKVPIITLDGALRYFTPGETVALLPPKMLDDGELYGTVYPNGRLMSDIYLEGTTGKQPFMEVLVKKQMIYDSMLTNVSSCKLDSRELRHIIINGKVKGAEHSIEPPEGCYLQNVAFLSPDLIGAFGHDAVRVKNFVHLLLKKLKGTDILRMNLAVSCSCGESHNICPALWLAHLKTKKWVPMKKEEEGEEITEPSRPSQEALDTLFDKELDEIVLEENGIELFKNLGYDELDLKIRKMHIETDQSIETIKMVLSNIVETGDLTGIRRLAEIDVETRNALLERLKDLIEKKKAVETNKEIGKLVEEKIAEILYKKGVTDFKLQYKECDIIAYIRGDLSKEDVDQSIGHCLLGPFYIEIKKTVGNRVRMTRAEAARSFEEKENYVLCVVKILSDQISKENIEKCALFVGNVGQSMEGIAQSNKYAEIDINGYWIKSTLWQEKGVDIDEWLSNVKHRLKLGIGKAAS